MDDHRGLIRELRRALRHLDDPGYLETLPLLGSIQISREISELSDGQALRRTLLLAIKALAPRDRLQSEAVNARCHEILYRYAVSKQSMIAIAAELFISDRQAYRELNRAIDALARILANLGVRATATSLNRLDPKPGSSTLYTEVERIVEEAASTVDLTHLVRDVVASMQPLAEHREIQLELLEHGSNISVTIQRVMLRQVLLNLLSYVLGATPGEKVTIALSSNRSAILQIRYRGSQPACEPEEAQHPYIVATELVHSMGISWNSWMEKNDVQVVEISIPLQRQEIILIVDDNEGLTALFKRYLRNQPYLVYSANTLEHAMEIAGRVNPTVVIVDILMPDRDGWEVLQALRHGAMGRKMRVIVCSVINDPRLKVAMNADAFINKPVSRLQLLQTLDDVLSKET